MIDDLSAESLIACCKYISSEYGSPTKIVSHAGTNFILQKLSTFCSKPDLSQAITSE